MRIRSVKPEFLKSEKLARLSRDARLVYIALWIESDDYGKARGGLQYLQGSLFPYDPGEWFASAFSELVSSGRVVPYSHSDESFIYLPKFKKHQYINKPSKGSLPDPPETLREPSGSTPVAVTEGYGLDHGSGNRDMEQGSGIKDRDTGPSAPAPGPVPVGQGGKQEPLRSPSEAPSEPLRDVTPVTPVTVTPVTGSPKPARAKKPPRHITPQTPKDGLDAVDLSRRAFAVCWKQAERHNGASYPDQPEKDRKAAASLLSYHRRSGVEQPWKEWLLDVFKVYLADSDHFLVNAGHALCLLPSRLPFVVAKLAKESNS